MILIAVLLLLTALTALVVTMSMTTVLEKTVTVNHHTASRALFSADSGVEAARQQVTSYAQAVLDSLSNEWAGNGPIIADPAGVFPAEGTTVDNTSTPEFQTTTTITFEDSTLDLTSQAYNYRYTTTARGFYGESERAIVTEGRLRLSATRGSFADYLIFTNEHNLPSGNPIWFHTTGHFDGRVHTNGQFRFAYFPTFEDLVSSAGQTAYYYNNGSPLELDDDHNGTIDVPNFYGGFDRNVDPITLPSNSYGQERAALGGNPADTSPLSNDDIRDYLDLPPGGTPPPDGVYFPNSASHLTGGIYVAGDANQILLYPSGDSQMIRITDSGNNVTLIEIDPVNDVTRVTGSDSTTVVYTGVPRGCLYTRGQVLDLRGPERVGGVVQPAMTRDQQMLVAATGDIVIRRDITLEDYTDSEGILGIFSSAGDVRISTGAPDELSLDAFVMASATGKVFTVDDYNNGSYRGQVHLRGGMITNKYGAFGTFSNNGNTGYGRDFRYDRRGYVPPYFPVTQRFVPDQPQPQVFTWREVYQ